MSPAPARRMEPGAAAGKLESGRREAGRQGRIGSNALFMNYSL